MSNFSKAEIQEVTRKYQSLKSLPSNILKGQINLVIKGELYHQFDLTIQSHIDHPYRFPMVWETGGDIPRIVDRHVFPETGNLCFGVRAEERVVCSGGISLSWFFDNVLVPRLADEYCVMNGGEYKKERSHGILGDWEYYFKEFNTDNPLFILTILVLLKLRIPPKSNDMCLCGSGNKYSECHERHLVRFIRSYYTIQPAFWEGEIQKLKLSK